MTIFFGTIAIALLLFILGYAIFWFIANVLFDQDPWQF
jgi:hypothetical protein